MVPMSIMDPQKTENPFEVREGEEKTEQVRTLHWGFKSSMKEESGSFSLWKAGKRFQSDGLILLHNSPIHLV